MLTLLRYLSAMLTVLLTVSEVRPATSRRPATLGPAGADPGDRQWDATGTLTSPFSWPREGLFQRLVQKPLLHLPHTEPLGGDESLMSHRPGQKGHRSCQVLLPCLYSELVCFFFVIGRIFLNM